MASHIANRRCRVDGALLPRPLAHWSRVGSCDGVAVRGAILHGTQLPRGLLPEFASTSGDGLLVAPAYEPRSRPRTAVVRSR